MNRKRAAAPGAVLVAVLLVALFGFASTGKAEGAPQPPVTLQIMGFADRAEPDGIHQNPVAKYIQDKLGITMDFTVVADGDGSDQKVSALIASDDLPDICMFYTKDNILNAKKAGIITPLDDLLARYGTNTMKDKLGRAMVLMMKKTYGADDGKTWAYGMAKGTYDNGMGPLVANWIRWDLYKKIGYPAINSDDDLLNALAKMQAAEPTTVEGNKVYAMGLWSDWGTWNLTYKPWFTEGIMSLSIPGMYYNLSTNSLLGVLPASDPKNGLWRSARFFNKAKQMGILDPESFTQKYDVWNTKATTGQYLWIEPGWVVNEANKYFDKVNAPQKGFASLPPYNTDAWALITLQTIGERPYVISKKSQHPDRAMQLLDWLGSYEGSFVVYNGPEGNLWNLVNGVPTPTQEYLKATVDKDFEKTTGAQLYNHFMGYFYATIDPTSGVAVDLYNDSPQAAAIRYSRPIFKDMLDHYKVKDFRTLYTRNLKAYNSDGILLNALPDLPPDLKTQAVDALTFETNQLNKAMIANSDAEFKQAMDEYTAGIGKYPLDAIFKLRQQQAADATQKYKDVFDLLK